MAGFDELLRKSIVSGARSLRQEGTGDLMKDWDLIPDLAEKLVPLMSALDEEAVDDAWHSLLEELSEAELVILAKLTAFGLNALILAAVDDRTTEARTGPD